MTLDILQKQVDRLNKIVEEYWGFLRIERKNRGLWLDLYNRWFRACTLRDNVAHEYLLEMEKQFYGIQSEGNFLQVS